MNKTISNIFIGLISASLLVPFIFTIFFSRTAELFTFVLVNGTALIAVMTFYIGYWFFEKRKNYIRNTGLIIGSAILFFLFTHGYQLDAANYVFYKQREKSLNEFVSQIKQYGKIKSMTNVNAHLKKLNDSLYEFTEKEVHDQYSNAMYLHKDLLEKLEIDEKVHRDFLNKLSENNFMSFETFEDGTISFLIGGMLDNCYGFAYSETGEHPEFNDCGRIIRWEKVSGNWYAWGTT